MRVMTPNHMGLMCRRRLEMNNDVPKSNKRETDTYNDRAKGIAKKYANSIPATKQKVSFIIMKLRAFNTKR